MVVDELHMVADGDRGIGLEMSLSKLMHSSHARHVQVVGMSATSERREGASECVRGGEMVLPMQVCFAGAARTAAGCQMNWIWPSVHLCACSGGAGEHARLAAC